MLSSGYKTETLEFPDDQINGVLFEKFEDSLTAFIISLKVLALFVTLQKEYNSFELKCNRIKTLLTPSEYDINPVITKLDNSKLKELLSPYNILPSNNQSVWHCTKLPFYAMAAAASAVAIAAGLLYRER